MDVEWESPGLHAVYPALSAGSQPMLLNHQREDAASSNPSAYPATTSERKCTPIEMRANAISGE